jgi:hypothetical protein
MLDRALNTSVRLLTGPDIKEIASGGVQEDGTTEFKSGLDEGQERDQVRWADGGKLSRPAKTDLLRPLIAFANAFGGTLCIGVKESDDDPKRSCGLAPLPRISELEVALCDAIRDTIEPRLPSFESQAFKLEGDHGVLAIRVPASPVAPHWNANERQCYQRIGASSQRIGMREIQSITLDRARRLQYVDNQFDDRRTEFERLLQVITYKTSDPAVLYPTFPSAGMTMRCTCIPLMPITVERITDRADLRIGVQPARVISRQDIPGTPREMGIRVCSNIQPVEFTPALRGWSYRFAPVNGEVFNSMLVRGDGLIERVFADLTKVAPKPGQGRYGVPFISAVAFVLSTVTSCEVFRTRTGTNEVPYELEFDLIANPDRYLMMPDSDFRGENYQLSSRRTVFPRLLLGRRESFIAISDTIQIDLLNAAARMARVYFDFDVVNSLQQHEINR